MRHRLPSRMTVSTLDMHGCADRTEASQLQARISVILM
jgi:hypothetical protein